MNNKPGGEEGRLLKYIQGQAIAGRVVPAGVRLGIFFYYRLPPQCVAI